MRRISVILILLLCITAPGFGQWYPIGKPYHTQYLFETRSDSTLEWENNWRTQFGYDQRNRRDLVHTFQWFNGRWRIQNEQKREFDNEDNLIYNSDKNWYNEPYRLGSESISKWEYNGKMIVKSERWNKDYESGNTYDSYSEFKYNENGNTIETLRKSRENNDPYTVSQYNVYFNEDQCQIAWASRWGQEGEVWNNIDSTHVIVDSRCETVFEERYSINPNTNEASLYTEYRYERDYGEFGRLIYLKLEQKLPNQDWHLISEDLYEYDTLNRRIFEEHRFRQDSGFFAYRLNDIYDNDSLDYLQTTEIREPQDSLWTPTGYYGIAENESGRIILSTGKNIWYDEGQEYFNRYRVEYFLDGDSKLIRSLSTNESSGPNEEPDYFVEREEIYFYRCDGEEVENISTILDSSEAENIGKQDRRTNEFLTQPICAEAEEGSRITLFPNPAQGYMHVSYPEQIGLSRISIVDQSGKTALEKVQNVSSYFTLDLAGMNSGSYIFKIESDKVNDSQRFVVVK